MKKLIIYPLVALVTAIAGVAVIYRNTIIDAATGLYNNKIKPIQRKRPKQRTKASVAKKVSKSENKIEKQTKAKDIKLVRKSKPKAQNAKTQRQKSKNVVSIK